MSASVSSPAKTNPLGTNQYTQRRLEFALRVQKVREPLNHLMITKSPIDDPELPAKARAIMLLAERGATGQEVSKLTGLSASCVQRAKLRFELYGLPGLRNPKPLPKGRS